MGSSAPGIFCAAGSSQANDITCSTMSSWVFGPAAARRCFSMVRQYSSAQSCSTLQRRKTDTSSELLSPCRAGCGSKKFWPWIFTRPDESASGMFLFQYWPNTTCKHAPNLGKTDSSYCTYIVRISQDGFPILDNETELRVMLGERQRLRANTASNIDDKRALRKAFPAVPYKFGISKMRL